VPSTEALLESWQLSLHDKSRNTVKLYLGELRRFAAWLADAGRPAKAPGVVLHVGRQDVEAHLSALREAGKAPAGIRARWVALSAFYRWLASEDEVDASPMVKVTAPKADPPPIDVVTAEAFEQLLKACAGRGFIDRRDAALLACLWSTGLRVFEVCALQLEDVDLMQRVALVRHGKGDRHRLVRFDGRTAALVDRYKRARSGHKLAASPHLWLGPRQPLGPAGVAGMLDRRAVAAGLGHLHPHQFRHTFADRWLAAGGTEGDLQRLGGWQDSASMRRYGAARATDRALAAYDQVLRDVGR
jgi:site-specific recombinase XerD